MVDNITWLLIANASKAKLFAMRKARFIQNQLPSDLTLLDQFDHGASRMKGAELVTDKLGGFGTGTFVEATSPKTHEAEAFAQELVGHLESARKDQSYRDLIIIAPPTFMGLLNKHMPQQVHKLVSQNIEKDYTQHEGLKLIQNLMEHF